MSDLFQKDFFHNASLRERLFTDKQDRNWAYMNYLSARALAQADNVRAQLERTMERYEIELISTNDIRKLHIGIRRALVCGFFMQVAHREGEKKGYVTVKDNQVRGPLSSKGRLVDLYREYLCAAGCQLASVVRTR